MFVQTEHAIYKYDKLNEDERHDLIPKGPKYVSSGKSLIGIRWTLAMPDKKEATKSNIIGIISIIGIIKLVKDLIVW